MEAQEEARLEEKCKHIKGDHAWKHKWKKWPKCKWWLLQKLFPQKNNIN